MQCTSKLNTPCTYTPQQSKQKMNDTQKINKIIIQTKKTKNSNARKAKVFTISTSAVPADTSEGFMGSLFLIAPLWADSGINLSGALSKKHMQLWKKISEVVTVGGKKKKRKKKEIPFITLDRGGRICGESPPTSTLLRMLKLNGGICSIFRYTVSYIGIEWPQTFHIVGEMT